MIASLLPIKHFPFTTFIALPQAFCIIATVETYAVLS